MQLNLKALILVPGFILALGACQSDEQSQQAPMAMPPQQVDALELISQQVEIVEELPARAVAFKVAEVRPQVTGIVQQRNFAEGSYVEAGQTLYQIDDAVYQANYQSAKAELSRTQANLTTARAELNRYQALITDKAVSQQTLDQAQANYQALEAQIAMNKAALHKASVDLAYTKVLAPISGKISKSNISEGALVSAGQTASLATITQLDPIYFDMVQASSDLAKLQQQINSGELNANAAKAILQLNGQQHIGEVLFSEVQVNPTTDTVAIRSEFANPDKSLLPGMFAKIKLIQATRANSILVPQKAIMIGRKGQASAYVVTTDNKVAVKTVSIGRSFADNWLVTSGLNAGDTVILTGLQKIAPNAQVNPTVTTQQAE